MVRPSTAQVFSKSDSFSTEVVLEGKLLQWFVTGASERSGKTWINDTDFRQWKSCGNEKCPRLSSEECDSIKGRTVINGDASGGRFP